MLPWNDGVAGHSEARLTDDVFAEVNAYGTSWRARVAMNDLRDSGLYPSLHDAQTAAEDLVRHHFEELSAALKDQPTELAGLDKRMTNNISPAYVQVKVALHEAFLESLTMREAVYVVDCRPETSAPGILRYKVVREVAAGETIAATVYAYDAESWKRNRKV